MSGDIAVVVVTFNSAGEIGPCLRSVRQMAGGGQSPAAAAEVVVVDNASTDDTCQVAAQADPAARLIRNCSNRGFAAAVNQAIQATTRPLLLLLNPDAILKTPLSPMAEECRRAAVGAVGGKLVDVGGLPQRGFNIRSFPTPAAFAAEVFLINRLWPSNPVNRRYRRLDFDPEQAQDVEQPAGAFLMLRRDVLETIGGLDEDFYPLWFEDVDLCLRIRNAGYALRYVPGAMAEHGGAHSLRTLPVQARHLAWYGNLLRFGHKHFSPAGRRWLRPILLGGVFCRWLACRLKAGAGEERRAYRQTMKMLLGARRSAGRAEVRMRTTPAVES